MPNSYPNSNTIPKRLQTATVDPTILTDCNHWSTSIKAGERKIIDGIIVTKIDDNTRNIPHSGGPVYPGVPEDEQPDYDIEPIDIKDVQSVDHLLVQRQKHTEWYAKYNGKFLSPEQKSNYEKLCLQTSDNTKKTILPFLSKIIDKSKSPRTNFASLRAKLADIIAAHQLVEYRIFQGNIPAQERRYGSPILEGKRTLPQQAQLKDALEQFLSGAYLQSEKQKNSLRSPQKSVRPKTNLGLKSTPRGPVIADIEFIGGKLQAPKGKIRKTIVRYDGEPIIAAVEGRVYVFEHEALDIPFTDDDPKHTSIVAGVWTIEKQHKTTEVIERNATYPPKNATRDVYNHWFDAKVIERKSETCIQARFFNWDLANGCAGTYREKDNARLIYHWCYPVTTSFPDTLAELHKRSIFSCIPHGNDYPRVRAVAYPKGNYGISWVCHNCANAFAVRKWGIGAVESIFTEVFGDYGLLGISTKYDDFDPFQIVHVGGVPGNECYYNITPPWADPILAQIQEPFMDGHGHGLDFYWNPNGNWSATDAGFNEKSVGEGKEREGCDGKDDPWDDPIQCTPAD